MKLQSLLLATACCYTGLAAAEVEMSAEVGFEWRHFPQTADMYNDSVSVVIEPEIYREWKDGDVRGTLKPFARWDDKDDNRTHTDIREASLQFLSGDFELMLGIGQEFWGTLEGVHIVDIINQTDFVENIDGEDKLGQPMAKLTWLNDLGNFEAWYLPYFRKRTYPGPDGRPQGPSPSELGAPFPFSLITTPTPVNQDEPSYESDEGRNHKDAAFRYSTAIGGMDVALSWFKGTSREPELRPQLTGLSFELVPHYAQLEQYGFDAVWALGGWLLKGEYAHRKLTAEDYDAYGVGAEYTLVGVFGDDMDLGLIAEFFRDERDTTPVLMQRDLLVGTRWVFNDADSTEILAGAVFDQDSDAYAVQIEATTRLSDSGAINIEYRRSGREEDPVFQSFEDDELFQVEYRHYF